MPKMPMVAMAEPDEDAMLRQVFHELMDAIEDRNADSGVAALRALVCTIQSQDEAQDEEEMPE